MSSTCIPYHIYAHSLMYLHSKKPSRTPICSTPPSIGLAVAVFFICSMLHVSLTFYAKQQEKIRGEKDRWEKSQEERRRAQEDAKKAEMDR